MAPKKHHDERWEIFRGIWKSVSTQLHLITARRTRHLSADFLSTISVSVSHLDWNPEDSIDLEPRYCKPYPSDRFETFYQLTKNENLNEIYRLAGRWNTDCEQEETESGRRLARARNAFWHLLGLLGSPTDPKYLAAQGDWLHCGTGGLYQYRASECERRPPSTWSLNNVLRSMPWPQGSLPEDPEELEKLRVKLVYQSKAKWKTVVNERVRRPGKKSLVHLGIIVSDDSDVCEDRILRSELIAALGVMRDQMAQRLNNKHHAIFPVFVYSWSGYHVRVLQIHFDLTSWRLVVRKTRYIEISSDDQENEIKLMLRWIMNIPIGSTSWDELDMSRVSTPSSSDSSQDPSSPSKDPLCVSHIGQSSGGQQVH